MATKRKLDNWLLGYLEYVDETEPDDEYKKWAGISTISSAAERTILLQWDHLTTIYPNFFVILVGASACRKTTSMLPGEQLLRSIGDINFSPNACSPSAAIETLSDITALHLGHCSMTVHASEIVNFISFDNEEFFAYLCDWYDCLDTWNYRTRAHGYEQLENIYINLIGAITPNNVEKAFPREEAGKGGLTGRTIFVYAERVQKRITKASVNQVLVTLGEALQHDLRMIKELKGFFQVTEEFDVAYDKWYQGGKLAPNLDGHTKLETYIERKPTHLRKLAMVVSLAQSDNLILTAEHFETAMILLEQTELRMPMAFGQTGKDEDAQIVNEIIRIVFAVKRINFAELYGFLVRDIKRDALLKLVGNMAKIQPPFFVLEHSEENGKAELWLTYLERKAE